jgi:predicted mannosyl-3-phosphoglycerate phosphatase (HAD superfamily)
VRQKTDQVVLIPQLQVKRTIYVEDGHKYIMMDKEWVEMDGYKQMLKDIYSINISYEYPETMYKRSK